MAKIIGKCLYLSYNKRPPDHYTWLVPYPSVSLLQITLWAFIKVLVGPPPAKFPTLVWQYDQTHCQMYEHQKYIDLYAQPTSQKFAISDYCLICDWKKPSKKYLILFNREIVKRNLIINSTGFFWQHFKNIFYHGSMSDWSENSSSCSAAPGYL